MEWIKAVIKTSNEGVEPVFGILLANGINGAEIIDPTDLRNFLSSEPRQWDYVDNALLDNPDAEAQVAFYLTPDGAGNEILSHVKTSLSLLALEDNEKRLGSLTLTTKSADDASWLNEWKKHYKPFRIGKSVVICPVWEKYGPLPGDIVFTIDPGSVFGTGLHQTTQLCIEAMEEYIAPGDKMMDLGCGSGILSVIGLMLGAADVFACDFDPAAGIATRENAARNPVDESKLTFVSGDAFEILSGSSDKKDVVVANIVADVIIKLAPKICAYLKHGGLYIASGIIDDRVCEVREALTGCGFVIEKELTRDGWFCVVSRYA